MERIIPHSKKLIVVLITILLWLISTSQSITVLALPLQQQSKQNFLFQELTVEPSLRQSVEIATQRQFGDTISKEALIITLIAIDERWAYGTVGIPASGRNGEEHPQGRVFVASWMNAQWNVVLEFTDQFQPLVGIWQRFD